MGVPDDIQRRMDKTRAKRDEKNTKAVVKATKDEIKAAEKNARRGRLLLLAVLLLPVLAACGPTGSTPTHPATTVAVPVPAVS